MFDNVSTYHSSHEFNFPCFSINIFSINLMPLPSFDLGSLKWYEDFSVRGCKMAFCKQNSCYLKENLDSFTKFMN